MSDFRLKVFQSVAKNRSFTKASKELNISQPAVSRHIKELEEYYNVELFDRNSIKVELTEAGRMLLEGSNEILEKYNSLFYDMHNINDTPSGEIKIGASTTIAQYILPQIMAHFHKKYENIKMEIISGNTNKIEELTLNKSILLGMVEGRSKNPYIKYIPFLKDEIVAAVSNHNELCKIGTISSQQIKKQQLVLREYGSGTYQVIANAFAEHNIKLNELNVISTMDATESIKNYIINSDAMCFVSIYALKSMSIENNLCILDLDDFSITREFCFALPFGPLSNLQSLFINEGIRFLIEQYGKCNCIYPQ